MPQDAVKQSDDVGIEQRTALLERHRQNRVRSILTNSGKREKPGLRARHPTAVALYKSPAEVGQASASMQKSQGSQELDYFSGLGVGESLGIRVPREEALIDRFDEVGPRSLKEKLRYEHRIRIVGASPGEVSPALAEPPEHSSPEPLGVYGRRNLRTLLGRLADHGAILAPTVGVFTDLRREYHERLCREILGYRSGTTIYNVADRGSVASIALAQGMADAMGFPPASNPPASGQTAGSLFTLATRDFLEGAFEQLSHLRPGSWFWVTKPSEAAIAVFDQFDHLAELQQFLHAHRELETALGSDYLITPDIVIGRRPVEDEELNAAEELISEGESVARLTPLRSANKRRPILHASISCKWTMRSDRAQNTRTEALNLIRNRKGRTPHVVAVTIEPLPGRLASIAMGTGDVDCTYHAALDELLVAAADSDFHDAYELLQTLVDGRRLRDISDLPLDLAS